MIASAREGLGFLLTAWVFLPDHWHAVIFPPHPLTISKVMKVIKSRSTLHRREREIAGDLWQARFYEHALRTVKEYHDGLRNIHHNPVERGLASRAEEWKWSSVRAYHVEGEPTLAIDRVRLPADLQARI